MRKIFGTTPLPAFTRAHGRARPLGLSVTLTALAALTACTTNPPQPSAAATSSAATPGLTASDTATPPPTPPPTPTDSATAVTASPTDTSASPTPSPTPTPTSSPTPTPRTGPGRPQPVQDVAWDSARLPVMCGGAVEMVQLKKGAGKLKDGLTVEYLDVTFGSVTSDPARNIAVVELDCVGAHPGPVDAPVFRSGPNGPEFLGFATMSLDRFGSAVVSQRGVVIHGVGYSDKAAGCCPDLAATMISSVLAGGLALQERDTVPLPKSKPGTQCQVLVEVAAQSDALAKQTRGQPTSHAAVALGQLTPAVAARHAQQFLDVLRAQLQRGCP